MLQKSIVTAAAWFEIIVGIAVLAVPNVPSELFFGAKVEGVGTILARFAGIGIFALGIACLPSAASASHRSAVHGLLVFNFGVVILFVWVGVATVLRGVLLWPGAVLHGVIAGCLGAAAYGR
jgi:heme A synthase